MKILDYVIKDNPGSLDYVLRLIQFIVNNQNTAIMIVDDSKTARYDLAYAIKRIPVEIFQAKDGEEALEILEVNPHIRLILTDQEMPKMGGIKLLQKIRRKHSINELVVIGTSGSNDKSDLTIDFLKSGGNDFITKPIVHEELLTRVISNIEMLDYIKIAKESAVRDFLTGLYNRRYLYDAGTQLFENGKRKNFNIVACMLDIDFFKKVNDTYGHYAGDLALKEVSSILEKSLRGTDIVSRFGGEEFCIILSNSSLDDAHMVMEKIRKGIEALTIEYNEITFKVTISIGMTQTLGHTLSDMISIADTALYKAKESGRNCIVIE
jgi:diguanylate cyclase (GGDEF)-like protein